MEATLRFELRLDKINKKGEHPLILVVRVAAQRKKLSTGITLVPELWDNEQQRISTLTQKQIDLLRRKYGDSFPTKSQLYQYQDILNKLHSEIQEAESKFIFNNTAYSAESLVDYIKNGKIQTTVKEEPDKSVFDLSLIHI